MLSCSIHYNPACFNAHRDTVAGCHLYLILEAAGDLGMEMELCCFESLASKFPFPERKTVVCHQADMIVNHAFALSLIYILFYNGKYV